MNYYKLLKNFFNEAVSFKTYKKLGMPLGILAAVALLPFILLTGAYMITMASLLFAYGSLESSVKFLEIWLDEKRKNVKHATEAVLYAVCMPTIFFFTFLLSMFASVFYILWFVLQVIAYIATLGATKWQPLISYASYDDEGDFSMKYDYNAAFGVIVGLLMLFVGWLVVFIIAMSEGDEELFIAFSAIYGTYTLCAYVGVPIVFRKSKGTEEAIPVKANKAPAVEVKENFSDSLGDFLPEI